MVYITMTDQSSAFNTSVPQNYLENFLEYRLPNPIPILRYGERPSNLHFNDSPVLLMLLIQKRNTLSSQTNISLGENFTFNP